MEAQERLDKTMTDLNIARRRLRDVLERIADLEDQFTATQARICGLQPTALASPLSVWPCCCRVLAVSR